MKFIKEDGTIEEGTPLTEEQVRVKDIVHALVCHFASHYAFQGTSKCARVAIAVGEGSTFIDALEKLIAKPEPAPVPEPIAIEAVTLKPEEMF